MFLSEKIREDIIMIVESLGLKVYDIEYSGSKITVYIDKDGGVSIGDCETVSKNIGVMLDALDPIEHSYILEVSSPGMNRKLRKVEHFKYAVGKKCIVKTHKPVDSSKIFRGVLSSCDDNGIVINTDKGDVHLEFDNIKKARIDNDSGGDK